MTILLKRNNQKDAYFTVHGFYINEGDTVELIKVNSYIKRFIKKFPPDIDIRMPDGSIHPASLNCYDYVKQS